MHSIHGYIIGNTAFCNMLVMRHVKFTAIRRFYTNIISYTCAIKFMPAGNSQLALCSIFYMHTYHQVLNKLMFYHPKTRRYAAS